MVNKLNREFDEQITHEAKFVKAIDKIESVFHMYSETGKKFLHKIEYTRELHNDYKGNIIKQFPIVRRFETVMADVYEQEGFYFQAP
jgi:5'-deoxynucleotidase YfbR-like HD superfamily hydrolase